jgi:hypothetical protein
MRIKIGIKIGVRVVPVSARLGIGEINSHPNIHLGTQYWIVQEKCQDLQ